MKGASARWESSALPFTTLLARLTPYIEARSARLARQDRELQQDLQQEGRIALWRLDPARIEAAACADAYCRASIRFAMSRYLQRSARHVPGDHRISWGRVEAVLESYGRRAA
jgi:hypothetical protein